MVNGELRDKNNAIEQFLNSSFISCHSPLKKMPNRERKNIRVGLRVAIVLKQDQRTGRETIGVVKDLLTNSNFHPHGIKVRLTDGQVGRVQKILEENKESKN